MNDGTVGNLMADGSIRQMTAPLTEEALSRLEELRATATAEGLSKLSSAHIVTLGFEWAANLCVDPHRSCLAMTRRDWSDAIEASYNAIPALLREIRELRAENAGLREALKPFAEACDDIEEWSAVEGVPQTRARDDYPVSITYDGEIGRNILIGDLRRAKTACEDAGKGATHE